MQLKCVSAYTGKAHNLILQKKYSLLPVFTDLVIVYFIISNYFTFFDTVLVQTKID